MAVHHDALVLGDDLDEWSELGVVFCCGDVRVMQLQEFPGGVGVREGGVEEVDLGLGCVVAGFCVGVSVDGCVLLVLDGEGKGRRKRLFGSCQGSSLNLRPRKLRSNLHRQDHRYNMAVARYPDSVNISVRSFWTTGLTKYHLSSYMGATLVWKSTPGWPGTMS